MTVIGFPIAGLPSTIWRAWRSSIRSSTDHFNGGCCRDVRALVRYFRSGQAPEQRAAGNASTGPPRALGHTPTKRGRLAAPTTGCSSTHPHNKP
jgi:hypothetical protein